MPAFNPLVEGVPMFTAAAVGGESPAAPAGVRLDFGPVHVAIVGMVALALVGLVLLHRAGFSFHVKVGRQ